MKRWVKNSIIITCCLAPIAFVVAFSTSWVSKESIFCVGSSGVKPFVEKMGNNYNSINPSIDVTVEAGGSGFGIGQVADGYTNIGDASKNPFNVVNNTSYEQKWKDKRIKTITIAWEAICIVYIPPIGVDLDNSFLELNINENNIVDFYAAFTGYYGNNFNKNEKFENGLPKIINNQPSMGLFVSLKDEFDESNLSGSQIESIKSEFEKWCRTPLTPYARSGGSTTSGTASAFLENSHFSNAQGISNPETSSLTIDQINALETGKYGNDFKVQETDEANSRAWDMFSKDNKSGSVVYLSSGFVELNETKHNLISKNNYGIASYSGNDYSINDIASSYNWFRPINLITSVDNEDYIRDFIQWIIVDENNEQSEMEKEQFNLGGKALTWSQIKSMSNWSSTMPKNNDEWNEFWKSFWVSDYELFNTTRPNEVFGAIE